MFYTTAVSFLLWLSSNSAYQDRSQSWSKSHKLLCVFKHMQNYSGTYSTPLNKAAVKAEKKIKGTKGLTHTNISLHRSCTLSWAFSFLSSSHTLLHFPHFISTYFFSALFRRASIVLWPTRLCEKFTCFSTIWSLLFLGVCHVLRLLKETDLGWLQHTIN